MILKSSDKILSLRDSLLWDIKNPNLLKSSKKIIERVVTRGNKNEFQQLLSVYSKDTIQEAILISGGLDRKTLNFLSLFYNIPKNRFLCYKKMQSKKAHWNY